MIENVAQAGSTDARHPAAGAVHILGAGCRSITALIVGGVLFVQGRGMLTGALTAIGPDALVRWVLLTVTALAFLGCSRLALVWALAAGIRLVGTGHRPGRALLAMLRVLAPRLARTLGGSLAATTVVAGLAIGPAQAAPLVVPPDGPNTSSAAPVDVAPHEVPATGAHAGLLPQGSSPTEAPDGGDLPPLGWGRNQDSGDQQGEDQDTEDPGTEDADSEDADSEDTVPEVPAGSTAPRDQPDRTTTTVPVDDRPPSDARDPDVPDTVMVHEGDTLWDLTDRLLEEDSPSDAVIAATWPDLYAANEGVIGSDPDHIEPGWELDVPAGTTASQEEK
jgi:hypothetical protein